jgi:hypothetical protein
LDGGDVQLLVPSVVQPTIDLIVPIDGKIPLQADAKQQSFFGSSSQTRTNQALLDTITYTVDKGYWEFTIILSSFFNWTGAGGLAVGTAIRINSGPFSILLLSHFPVTGAQNSSLTFKALLRAAWSFQSSIGVTGVGQTTDLQFSIVANRIL